MKLLKSKKAVNDVSILAIIAFIFLLTAVLMPLVTASFNTSTDEFDAEGYRDAVREEGDSVDRISALNTIIVLGRLASFDIGNSLSLPFWLDIIYFTLSIIFYVIIARNIWIGGGA